MSKRHDLERAVIKSATNDDETRHLLSLIDSCIAEELDSSDSLLISEITDLQLNCDNHLAELEAAKTRISELETKVKSRNAELNDLKDSFKRD